MTFLKSDAIHGRLFDYGIFSGHHASLFQHNPDRCDSCVSRFEDNLENNDYVEAKEQYMKREKK
jgi:hypothetical protein